MHDIDRREFGVGGHGNLDDNVVNLPAGAYRAALGAGVLARPRYDLGGQLDDAFRPQRRRGLRYKPRVTLAPLTDVVAGRRANHLGSAEYALGAQLGVLPVRAANEARTRIAGAKKRGPRRLGVIP